MMRIAFLDTNEYDDLEAYSRYGQVRKFNRFNYRESASADVIFTTYTKPPPTAAWVVNLASTDTRHLADVDPTRVIQAPQWNAHAVARWTLDRMPASYPLRVAVVGMGQIGTRVYRALHHMGHEVHPYHHTASYVHPVDVITLHLRYTGDNKGCADRYLTGQRGVVLINSARRGLVTDRTLVRCVRDGTVTAAHLDGGRVWIGTAPVVVTPHTAWRGPVSARLRPRRVLDVLKDLSTRRP